MKKKNTSIKNKNAVSKKSKKSKKVNKNHICKNNICVDKRIIKPHKKSYNKELQKNIYYFYDINSKSIQPVAKVKTFNNFKDNFGYLFSIANRYFVNELDTKSKKRFEHNIYQDFDILFKYTKEIKEDPLWAQDLGLTEQKPYLFGTKRTDVVIPEDNIVFDKETSSKDKDLFNKNIEKTLEKYKNLDFVGLDPYKDTLENLLDIFYNKCISTDTTVFKIIYYK